MFHKKTNFQVIKYDIRYPSLYYVKEFRFLNQVLCTQ